MAMDVKADVKKLTEKTINEGGVLATLYFDIHAATKEDAQKLGAGFLQHLIQMPGVVYAVGEIEEPILSEEGKNFSSYIEVKVLTRTFFALANICLTHSPFTIEIHRPEEIRMPLNQANELLGQLSATTADYKKMFITRLASPEELAEFQRQLALRAEMGKKILEKKDKK
ncbi:MAG: hypothetical protein QXF35_02975 [Candidatus Bilamarchaeaceae archaeon]